MPEWLTTVLFLFVNGLIWGLIIALIALGLSLIFGVMGIVNMAHGDIYMVGAVIAVFLIGYLRYGLGLINIPAQILLIVIGSLLVAAVLVPNFKWSSRARKSIANLASPASPSKGTTGAAPNRCV